MAQTVYTATLTGPLVYTDGLIALRRAQVESPEHPGQILREHALCYPPSEADAVLEPLYPDQLGEDFLALSTPGHNNAAYSADPWAIQALARLLSSSDEEDQPSMPWIPSAIELLTEIATRWPHMDRLTWAGALTTGRHHRRLL